ncbi:hypothetical protein TNCV_1110371 [Trichonephila clavipes]|nr:hypothetical protein TNCV_1110371 [Trichonephila clavipes]
MHTLKPESILRIKPHTTTEVSIPLPYELTREPDAAGKQGPARFEPSHRRSDAEARSTYANAFINGSRGPCRVR